ncbi:Leucyl aminopeptidase [Dethiosulfovibrio peptidovorans DSM 11002]|uniref:Probable cytosol aminopeptidase n=1 Tax=Dethiosulfovibrio peptidovorans DSM 11002 TaxID=469381 RepID=D2Z790_9BACT|nr:leucyl aminopeptidase [Dethiosulfovibrio peptidovorans]EFC91337.1 Leucyl aminopeptidase [Dethiosulfovibrio peptidovorans DSM 11002]
MDIAVFSGELPAVRAVAVLCFDDGISEDVLDGAPTRAMAHFEGKGKKGEFLRYPLEGEVRDLFLVGLGKRDECGLGNYRNAVSDAVRKVGAMGISELAFVLPVTPDEAISSAVAEGAVLGNYRFDRFRSPKEEERSVSVDTLYLKDGQRSGLDRGIVLGEAQAASRDLANRPGNDVIPETMADEAVRIAKKHGMECDVWDEDRIQEERMSALWHVGKGSENKPRFIHMVYRPAGKPRRKVALVGKGITFDSGGLCIKGRTGIRTMKCDKTGGCNVLAIMEAVGRLKPDIEVHGIVGAAENMPDGASYRPDDIVRARNGKTIEIVNTDAEGRVTLADSLSFASELEVDAIIDMATLTGAAVTALGNYTAGLICDFDDLSRQVMSASERAGERFHRFAMDDEKLREQIDSPVADVLNSGGPGGGMITAGMFLREFVSPEIPWAHMDIAGVDFYEKAFDCYGKGATAFGVRTCLEFLLS